MPGPWEKYQSSEPAAADGPWNKFKPAATEGEARTKMKDLPAPNLQEAGATLLKFVSGDGGAIGEGIPVLGPLAAKAGEHIAAVGPTIFGKKSYSENLEAIQKFNRDREAKFAEENPKIYLARKIIGAVGGAGAIPIPGAGATGAVAGPLTRVAGTTAISAADAAARGGDAQDVKRAATFAGGAQAAVETIPVVGRAIGPVAKPIAEGLETLGAKIGETAAGRAAKSILGNLKQNYKAIGGEGKVTAAGEQALESGAVKFGSNAGAISRRLDKSAKEAWSKVEETFDAAESAGLAVEGPEIAARIRAEAAKIKNVPKNESRIAELEREAAFYEQQGRMTLRKAQEFKNEYEWKNVDKLKDVLGKNGNNLMNRAIGESIKDVAGKVNPDFASVYQQSGLFGSLAKAGRTTAEQQSRNRSPFSLTDYIVGGAGGTAAAALTGNKQDATIAGFALAAANSLARTRGNSALAVSLSKLGQVMESSPQAVAKYYGVLEKAAQGGQASLAAAHATLMSTEPDYRKAIEQAPPQPSQSPGSMPIAPEDAIKRRIERQAE